LHASRQNLRTVKIVFSKAFFLSKCKWITYKIFTARLKRCTLLSVNLTF
jgi:hypothetical protein